MAKVFKNVPNSTEHVVLHRLAPAERAPSMQSMDLAILKKEVYLQGYAAGKEEEKRRKECELNELKHQLETTLLSIPDAVAQHRMELNKDIADIILLISQQFFIEQQTNTQALARQIDQILTQLNHHQQVELYLHPLDRAALHRGVLQLQADHVHGLTIKSDESLVLGGFIIKTSGGIFDASIEKQLNQFKEVLLQIKQGGYYVAD